MQNNIFPPNQNYEELVKRNQDTLKYMQTRYFLNQYQKSLSAKKAMEAVKKQQKQKEHALYTSLSDHYQEDINNVRQKKLLEKNYLSQEYQQAIHLQNQKKSHDKSVEKIVERGSLVSPTWVRDANQEREANRKNRQYYSQALNEHVRAQQIQKQNQRERQIFMRNKINEQAQKLLQKEYQYLQARHRQKSLFQKRQNELLGLTIDRSDDQERFQLHDRETAMKKKEKELYGQGLYAQIKKNQQKKRNSIDHSQINQHNNYNPITNPIPFVYKNPNVLRMLSIA